MARGLVHESADLRGGGAESPGGRASTSKVVERIVRSELIVVDDIGLLPAGANEAEAL